MKRLLLLITLICFALWLPAQGLWSAKAISYYGLTSQFNPSIVIQGIAYSYTGDSIHNFYAYDATTDTWTEKAAFPGLSRNYAVGFATDSFGYVGTGYRYNQITKRLNDFYRYNPATDSWSAIAHYPDSIYGCLAFGISNTGYVSGGSVDTGIVRRTWAYSAATNSWVAKASLPITLMKGFAAATNGKGYVGCGISEGIFSLTYRADSVFQYTPGTNSWAIRASMHVPNGTYTDGLYSFAINNKIYIADDQALSTPIHGGMHVYDIPSNTWSVINAPPYSGNCHFTTFSPRAAFTVNGKGYLKTTGSCLNFGPTNFWQFDTAHYFSVSSFSPADTICEGAPLTVTISSNLTFGSGNVFRLAIGSDDTATSAPVAGSSNGTYTFYVPYGTVGGYGGKMNVNILSSDPPAESGYLATRIWVIPAPRPTHLQDTTIACIGDTLKLQAATGAGSCSWTIFPGGATTYGTTFKLLPVSPVAVFLYCHLNTCFYMDTTLVTLAPHPLLGITDSSFHICPGSTATIGGVPVPRAAYTWSGSGLSSSLPDPAVSPSASSTYTVVVRDTVSGCTVSGHTTVSVSQAPYQPICFVTVDSTSTHSVIVWEKTNREATDSFHIYRETATNVYTEIGAVHGDSLSEYHDYAADPNLTAYRYKIGTRDTCHNASTLSHYHNTIHLQYLGTGNLLWNVYQIDSETTPVTSFDVYRDSLSDGHWDVLTTVPGTQYTTTDVNFSRHPYARYRIVANFAYSCTAARGTSQVLSNILAIGINGIPDVSEAAVTIYPNPAKDELLLLAPDRNVQEVTLTAIDGKVLKRITEPASNRVDVSYLAPGVYIAEIRINDKVSRTKWIKM